MVTRNNYNVNNNQLSVLEAGTKGNRVAIFLHGIPVSAELWRDTLEVASQQGWYCLAPDLPGYGQTVIKEKNFFTLPGTAQLLIHWIKSQNFKEIWLIGHDIGGGIAQLMITQNENLFQKVTLSNSITDKTWPIPLVAGMVQSARLGLFYWMARLGLLPYKSIHKNLSKTFIRKNENFPEEWFSRIVYDGKFDKAPMAEQFQKMLRKLDPQYTQENMAAISRVTLPVHLIWGMDDDFQKWEEAGEILKKTFKNVRVTPIENCGHYLQLDAPKDYHLFLLKAYQEA